MTDAGQHRKEQERKPDQDMIEDLQPRDDQSAGLQGGMSSENSNLKGEVHVSGGGKKT